MPGPPGIATLEMPRQPHELSKSASTSNTSPCQARWRITRIRASTLIIDPLLPQRATAPPPVPASVAPDPGLRRAQEAAVVSAPVGPVNRSAAARGTRRTHSGSGRGLQP